MPRSSPCLRGASGGLAGWAGRVSCRWRSSSRARSWLLRIVSGGVCGKRMGYIPSTSRQPLHLVGAPPPLRWGYVSTCAGTPPLGRKLLYFDGEGLGERKKAPQKRGTQSRRSSRRWAKTLPEEARRPSCWYSFVIQVRVLRTAWAVARESSRGTNMSSS